MSTDLRREEQIVRQKPPGISHTANVAFKALVLLSLWPVLAKVNVHQEGGAQRKGDLLGK
jgi:hypothetical protein